MKHLKKFTEGLEEHEEEQERLQPKVKHLIEYLSKLDPEMEVHLDKDGWDYGFAPSTTELELVENRGLFDVSTYGSKPYLMINN